MMQRLYASDVPACKCWKFVETVIRMTLDHADDRHALGARVVSRQ
jgi:hypothetical protein